MTSKIDINQLISDCINNSRKAQQQLFKLYYGKMLYLCLRYHSDRDTAQEVVQEGFIKVFEKLAMYDPKGSFEGWIRRIMVNTSIDLIRKEKRVRLIDLEDNHSNTLIEDESFDELEFEENSKLALACIQELSPGYKAVFECAKPPYPSLSDW